jgi:deoxyribodipyrimidine photolyase-related protein
MSLFLEQLRRAVPTKQQAQSRRWIYIPYDRLTDRTGHLHEIKPAEAGIIMVESLEKGTRRPYHKKKLALLLTHLF